MPVIICEDHQVYAAGLLALLASDPDLVLLGQVDDVLGAYALVQQNEGAVVVARQGLLRRQDYEPVRQLCARGALVLVLAESDSEMELTRALRAGAKGYLSRRLAGWQLRDAIHALARDEPAFDAEVARHLARHFLGEQIPASKDSTPLDQLTRRQRAVALLVARGLSNDEIAAQLGVSITTVKSHLAATMRRLDLRSRTQLAILLLPEARATA